ncbi:MAG TPA: hypothetical protein DDX40_00920 [Rikenellaceae bacterium]|nr:hypothetical protein [Rikenellaceae bacterium]
MKNILMPHKVQIAALLVFVADVLLLLSVTSFSIINDTSIGMTVQSLFLMVLYVSIFCCVFSREKYEDDNISRLRMKCATAVSSIGFLFIIILNIFQLLMPHDQFDAIKQWRMDFFWNGNFIINLAILYFIVFKVAVRKYRR